MWSSCWIGLLLTVTDISTTCAVVIFRIKASCITSVNGNKLWLLTWLVKLTANSVFGRSAFEIMPDTNFIFNQKQIPGSILGPWRFHFVHVFLKLISLLLLVNLFCLFFLKGGGENVLSDNSVFYVKSSFSGPRQSYGSLKSFSIPTGQLFGSLTTKILNTERWDVMISPPERSQLIY